MALSATNTGGGIDVIGDKYLMKKIDRLMALGAKRAQLRAAYNRASKPMREQARSNAKRIKKSGSLWKSIKMISSRRNKSLFWLGPARGKRQTYDAWYAYFLESGTKQRSTKEKTKRGSVVSQSRSTGRIKPYRFMAKAYFQKKAIVKINIGRELNKLIIQLSNAKV